MRYYLGKIKYILFAISIILVMVSCSTYSSGSRADFAVPGCQQAWGVMSKAKTLNDLHILVVENCSILYQKGWRLQISNKVVASKTKQCVSAWSNIEAKKQLDNTKFLITHNCPVFYRHGWIVPPL